MIEVVLVWLGSMCVLALVATVSRINDDEP
jgi:hypothetical protein